MTLRGSRDPPRDALRGAHIGYIFQMFNLIPYLNVWKISCFLAGYAGSGVERLNGTPLRKGGKEMAERLGIGSIMLEKVIDLSVGQQQRVAAARALLGSPELMIADEPTSALDEDQREKFLGFAFRPIAARSARR